MSLLRLLRAALIPVLVGFSAVVAAEGQVMVYKAPSCHCCSKWAEHMEAAGFQVETRDVENMNEVKAHYGVPTELLSCHTAVVDETWLVEGHVPADLVKRMMEDDGVKALAVPGMPIGSPGMEGPNPVEYDVLAIGADGRPRVYETVQGKAPGEE